MLESTDVLRGRGFQYADESMHDADVGMSCCLLVVAHSLVGQMLSEANVIETETGGDRRA